MKVLIKGYVPGGCRPLLNTELSERMTRKLVEVCLGQATQEGIELHVDVQSCQRLSEALYAKIKKHGITP